MAIFYWQLGSRFDEVRQTNATPLLSNPMNCPGTARLHSRPPVKYDMEVKQNISSWIVVCKICQFRFRGINEEYQRGDQRQSNCS